MRLIQLGLKIYKYNYIFFVRLLVINQIKELIMIIKSQEAMSNNKKCTCCNTYKLLECFKYKRNDELNKTCNSCLEIGVKSRIKYKIK